MAIERLETEAQDSPEHPLWRDAAVLVDAGWGRESNEDGADLVPEGSAALLADGVGSSDAGDEAMRVFLRNARTHAIETAGALDIQAIMHTINGEIHALQLANKEHAGMQTTAVIAQLALEHRKKLLRVAVVGDAKAVLTKDKRVFVYTKDWNDKKLDFHLNMDRPESEPKIEPSELDLRKWLVECPQRNFCPSALGAEHCSVEWADWEIVDEDQRLYLYSDGVGDNLTPAQVVDLGRNKAPQDACEAVFQHLDKQFGLWLLEICLAYEPHQGDNRFLDILLQSLDSSSLKGRFEEFAEDHDFSDDIDRHDSLYRWLREQDYADFKPLLDAFSGLQPAIQGMLFQKIFPSYAKACWSHHKRDNRSISVVDL